jgi:hypothetical protein
MTEEYTLGDLCEDCLTLPGHDNAIIGMVSQTISKHVLYHIPTIIQNLVNEGINMEDALEHFDYNIRGSSQGDSYPMFLDLELNPKSKNGEYVFEVREWGVI